MFPLLIIQPWGAFDPTYYQPDTLGLSRFCSVIMMPRLVLPHKCHYRIAARRLVFTQPFSAYHWAVSRMPSVSPMASR